MDVLAARALDLGPGSLDSLKTYSSERQAPKVVTGPMKQIEWGNAIAIGVFWAFLLIGLLAAVDVIHPFHLPLWLGVIGKGVIGIVGFCLTWSRWFPDSLNWPFFRNRNYYD